MRSILAVTAMLLGWVGSLVGCDAHPEPPPPRPPLRLAIDLWAGYFPALLADELGYFRDAGLQVQISLPGNTDRMMAEFVAGRHDLVAFALADLVNLTRSGQAVQVLLVSDESAGGDKLLRRPGVNPRAARLVVGTNLGGFGELFVGEYLARQGIAPQRVAWVNVDAADVGAALKKGEIDIGHSWDPYAAAARAEGAVEVFSSRDTPGLIPDVVVATQATIARRHDELRAFTAAWLRAADWWRDHADDGNQRLARRLQQSPQWVADALRGVRLATLADNRRQLGADGAPAALAPVLTRYSDFFAARGTLTRPVRPAAVLRADLLP